MLINQVNRCIINHTVTMNVQIVVHILSSYERGVNDSLCMDSKEYFISVNKRDSILRINVVNQIFTKIFNDMVTTVII